MYIIQLGIPYRNLKSDIKFTQIHIIVTCGDNNMSLLDQTGEYLAGQISSTLHKHTHPLHNQDWTQGYLEFIWHYFIFDKIVCFGDFLPMRTLCDACHKEFESR